MIFLYPYLNLILSSVSFDPLRYVHYGITHQQLSKVHCYQLFVPHESTQSLI